MTWQSALRRWPTYRYSHSTDAMEIDEKYMRRALRIARNGLMWALPNPMVGAVIVGADGRILGEGFHRRCGEAHAEVNALAAVKDKDALLDSTMYVTLEPCCHTGRTGPCAQRIIEAGIPRVVVGMRDPFAKVNGRGIELLQEAGVDVVCGVLEHECRQSNIMFITAHTLHRPYIVLKWAQSSDGYMDVKRAPGEPAAQISTPLSQQLVHRLRAVSDAVLFGSGTILSDNPEGTNRLWAGPSPQPVILDRRGLIKGNYKMLQRDPIIIRDDKPLQEIMTDLYEMGIVLLTVEAGPTLLQSFLQQRMWDVARVETSPDVFGEYGDKEAPVIFDKEPDMVVNVEGNHIKYYLENPLLDVKNL